MDGLGLGVDAINGHIEKFQQMILENLRSQRKNG